METAKIIPNGDGSAGGTLLQMTDIYRALARVDEIAIINGAKAPELIACFTRAYAALTDHLAVISTQVVKAKNAVAKRTAIVILDEVPRILREKGVLSGKNTSGSADQRQAVLDVDVEYQQVRDLLQHLEAHYKLMEGKQTDIEMMYLATRKIIGENSYGSRSFGSNFPGVDEGILGPRPAERAAPIVPAQKEMAPQGVRASFGKVRD